MFLFAFFWSLLLWTRFFFFFGSFLWLMLRCGIGPAATDRPWLIVPEGKVGRGSGGSAGRGGSGSYHHPFTAVGIAYFKQSPLPTSDFGRATDRRATGLVCDLTAKSLISSRLFIASQNWPSIGQGLRPGPPPSAFFFFIILCKAKK